jgi:hypothetical protein
MKWKTLLKIFLWTLGVVIVLTGAAFAYGYFYYGEIIRTYMIERIDKDSKGLYKLEIGDLNLDVVLGHITLKDFRIIPDTALYHKRHMNDTITPLLFGIGVKQFMIRDLEMMDAIRNRKIDIGKVLIENPEVTVFRMKMPFRAKDTTTSKSKAIESIPLPKGLSGIAIREFLIENAKMSFVDCTKDTITVQHFPETNISITNIIVDSVHRGLKRLYNADDINITIGGYSFLTKNGMNKISFGEIGLSTAREEVYVKNFHLEPQYNEHDYPRKMGFQCDRTEVKIRELRLQRLHLRQLLFEGKVSAGLITIDSLLIDDHRDMRVTAENGIKPPMPQDALRKLKNYLKIDTIRVTNGMATYREQWHEKPGTLFFDKINATFTNLTNDSTLLAANIVSELRGEAWLMGKGKLDVTLRFFFGDKKNTFTYSAQVSEMDLREINPMLSNLMPAKIESGTLKKLLIPFVKANDDEAAGKLVFYYNNLNVAIEGQDQRNWTKIKTGVINFAANNLVVNDNNPTKSGNLKTGTIYFQRNKHSSIFNYLWKSIFTGLKSTMGFNSATQKSMIKSEKEKHKEKKQNEKHRR